MEEWEEIDVWERELGPVCQTMSPEEIEYRTVLQKMRECLLMREVDNNLKAII